AELSQHFQAGRLTQDEFAERSGKALEAKTGNDLSQLFTDLPRRPAPLVTPPPSDETDPEPAFGPHPPARLGVARILIPVIVAVIIAGNVAGNAAGHTHSFGWLIPVAILSMVFLRLVVSRRR
ncbi:MAG TPA: DUF1707 domain-containing protein, partial [Trebonia sp.]|nr:DUF1707 domain-containing protein [Trebonia sp.]